MFNNVLEYLEALPAIKQDRVGRTEVDEYTIDTCYTIDCGYETAIWTKNSYTAIPERYKNREDALEGHQRWITVIRNEHPSKLWSVSHKAFVSMTQWEVEEI